MSDQKLIHDKGFQMYNKIKVGPRTLTDATINIEDLDYRIWHRANYDLDYTNKNILYRAIQKRDYETIRRFSRHYYEHNGIYRKVCDYLSTLYRYDWYIVPEILDEKYPQEKIKKEFFEMLDFLDGSFVKYNCERWAHNIIVDGIYFGYKFITEHGIIVQDLDPAYCRTRYSVGNLPVLEFNMRYFDDKFPDPEYRLKILNLFPTEFKKGYLAYKEGKLQNETYGVWGCWYPLDPAGTIIFMLTPDMLPWLIDSIPALIDLEVAKDIDRRKQVQQLAKIIVQKLPVDKNGDLLFDIDEAADLHANAVDMLKNVVGADVFTTFADVDDIDLSDAGDVSNDSVKNARSTVYDNMGVASNLFNSDGNLSVDKSAKVDAASIHKLILLFEIFFNRIVLDETAKPKKYKFRFYMLNTTQFNYKEEAEFYKQQTTIGNSKLLPLIAMGNAQSAILHLAVMENDVLELSYLFVPPLQSSSTSSEDLANLKQAREGKTEDTGRPELPDDQKSDKTIKNIESAG